MSWSSEPEITHLLMRTGFAITPEEAETAGRLGREETIRRIVQGQSLTGGSDYLPSAAETIGKVNSTEGKIQAKLTVAQTQWIYRMTHTQTPFIEKMTLFWHDHFATNGKKIDNAELMVAQNELFRTCAVGDFKELVKRVSRDGAMLIWLDANANQAGKPNENYARELMELFTLGIGNYTETDVKEAARAFTGWRASKKTGEVEFKPKLHDKGMKRVLRESGTFNDEDIVDILFRQEALSRFIVTKLLAAFATPTPLDSWVQRLATRFRERNHIGDVLSDLFLSPEFWDPKLRQALVKTPAEYAVWITRNLELTVSGKMCADLKKMGQDLYFPPDVNGWPNGDEWLGSANLLARYRFAESAASQAVKDRKFPAALEKPSPSGAEGAAQWIDAWAGHFRLTSLSPTTRDSLIRFVNDSGSAAAGKTDTTTLKGLIHLLLISPEAQMK